MAAASGVDASDILKQVDVLMTDTTSHNKGLGENLAKLFNLDTVIGQLFCSTHTNLGFCRSMNESIKEIEIKIGVENILEGFLVTIDKRSKNGCLAGQFVDCITRLAGKEMSHKPWNRGHPFEKCCIESGEKYEMFLYKDERFVFS